MRKISSSICAQNANTLLLVWLLTVTITLPVRSSTEDERSFYAGFQLDFLSKYTFRSFVYTDGPVMQPYLYTSYKKINFDISSNMNLDSDDEDHRRFNEYQFELYTDWQVGNITIEPKLVYYYYPDFTWYWSTGEVGLTLYYELGEFVLSAHGSVDVVEYDGYYYFQLGVSRSFYFSDYIFLDAGISIDYSEDPKDYNDSYVSGAVDMQLGREINDYAQLNFYLSFSKFITSQFDPEDDNLFAYGIGIATNY